MMKTPALCVAFMVLAPIGAAEAEAEVPAFSASCPTDITVEADDAGHVRINGHKAAVKAFNSDYYEARKSGVTISISLDPGSKALSVSYTGKHGANGICQVTAQGGGDSSAAAMPSRDEQACLLAVTRETNNGDVMLGGTETSEANTAVTVTVGPQRAPWRCLVKDGAVAEVMSMTDEGAL
jgi:hypothetical protein